MKSAREVRRRSRHRKREASLIEGAKAKRRYGREEVDFDVLSRGRVRRVGIGNAGRRESRSDPRNRLCEDA